MPSLITPRIELPEEPPALLSRVAAMLRQRMAERGAKASDDFTITLAVQPELGAEGFCIEDSAGGVRIAGGDPAGVLYGAGKFLRTARFTAAGIQPGTWRGASQPMSAVRGIYFAHHFHNWYQTAPAEELERYLEDLALWGINAMAAIFPFINLNDWEDDEAEPALQQLRRIFLLAKALGLRTCLLTGNVLFNNTPAILRATPVDDSLHWRGNFGAPVCPSNPQANAYLRECHRRLFASLADIGIDMLCLAL